MKVLAMHITNQKLSFDIFTVGHLQNMIFTYCPDYFWHKRKPDHFDPCSVLLAIATYDWLWCRSQISRCACNLLHSRWLCCSRSRPPGTCGWGTGGCPAPWAPARRSFSRGCLPSSPQDLRWPPPPAYRSCSPSLRWTPACPGDPDTCWSKPLSLHTHTPTSETQLTLNTYQDYNNTHI